MTGAERWLPVPGYEGLYEVSDLGRVRSLDRHVRGRGTGTQLRRGKILSPSITDSNENIYPRATLYRPGPEPVRKRQRSRNIHELVLEAFDRPRPEPPPGVYRMEARHLDGDPTNNQLSNLAWGTVSENRMDTVRMGRHINAAKTHCARDHPFDEVNTKWVRQCRACQGYGPYALSSF